MITWKIKKNKLHVIIYWMSYTWKLQAVSKNWFAICSDSSGTKLAACALDEYIYTSTNSGVTWSTNSNSSGIKNWREICSDSTGTKLAACVNNEYIYTSTDSGVTWSTNSNSSGIKNWRAICSDSTGTKLAACALDEYIYTSTNSGVTWSTNSSGIKKWVAICSNSTGTKLAVGTTDEYIYTGMLFNYNVTMYGKTNSLADIFQGGTTSNSSNFRQNGIDFNSLFKPYSSGYKAYFTQEFLGNTTTIQFPFSNAGTSLVTTYNLNPSFFYTVTGNDTTFSTVRTGYNYGFCFKNGGTIMFNTDTVVNIWMVGGGGGGGIQTTGGNTPRGAGGGGGGSVMSFNFPMINNITYNFTIGGGGIGGTTSTPEKRGTNGVNTSVYWTMNSIPYTISARGGGGGAAVALDGYPGGSGGGACAGYAAGSANATPIVSPVGPTTFTYTDNIISGPGTNNVPTIGNYSGTFTNASTTAIFTNYANSGGTAIFNGGGGGGGANSAGTNSSSANGGAGGGGVTITGTTIVVGGGGGGGGGDASGTGGSGGSGGGGAGGSAGGSGTAGTSNMGGGGGGSGNERVGPDDTGVGGDGGSGVVYLFF